MSLKERVSHAQGTTLREATVEDLFLRLRSQVNQRLSTAALLSLAHSNQKSAENEIRTICHGIFMEPFWLDVPPALRVKLVNDMVDSIFGFGPLSTLLEDDEVTEIMVNGPSHIYYEKGGKIYPFSEKFADEDQVRLLIDRIIGPLGRHVDDASPMVNARLPQGHRVNAVINPIALDGPFLTIRKFSSHLLTLPEMVEKGSLEPGVCQLLMWAVKARKNIAVSGGTGSGKTTFLNALSVYIPADERIVTIEDSAELRFADTAHVVRMEARERNTEGTGEVTIRDLLVNSLRMRPDRIVVGECRGAEALDMLQAMNTGHDGSLTTLHANSTAEVSQRLTTMVRYASDIPVQVVELYIARALDVVVQMARGVDGTRYVSEVAALFYSAEIHGCVAQPFYVRKYSSDKGTWLSCPDWVQDLEALECASSQEVDSWKWACGL